MTRVLARASSAGSAGSVRFWAVCQACQACGVVLLAGFFLGHAGCGDINWGQTKPPKPAQKPAPKTGTAKTQVPQHRSIAYRYPDVAPVLNVRGLREFASRFQDRVVLLDFWASWSRRGREDLSMLADLQKELAGKGFQVISCNFDPVDHWSTKTVPILNGARANYPCVVVAKESRGEIRQWLSQDWQYDVPARFVLDQQGKVVARVLSGEPLDTAVAKVRNVIRQPEDGNTHSGMTAQGAALMIRLVDVRTGNCYNMSEVFSDPADPRRLADQVVEFVLPKIDRSSNPRIAIQPFPSVYDRLHATEFGIVTAKAVEELLRNRGYYDLIGPAKTRELIKRLNTTALAIEYDPTVVKDRFPADYLVMGWLRGNIEGAVGPTVKFASDRDAEEGS